MTNCKLVICCITSALLLIGCNNILEPVSLFVSKQDITTRAGQEEFEINVKSLSFATAKKANNAPYSRQLILTGSGSKAKVLDEDNFLKPNFPKSSNSPDYLLGVGDKLLFVQLNEFETGIAQWPSNSQQSEYLLGVGDELTFIQSNDSNQNISVSLGTDGQLSPKQRDSSTLITTQGVVGTNGNILLFGLGNIAAANRTLDNVRTEVRNILIRNGLAPNFQLEINKFQSQKAFVSVFNNKSRVVFLNNLPITLKEVALAESISESNKNFALIKLTRNAQEFRLTAEQLFDLAAPQIIIQDNDQIEIHVVPDISTTVEALIGSKGNILLPNVGSISAVNRTLDGLFEEISTTLIKKGFKPNFQLELKGFGSKKAYLVQKNIGTKIVPLNNSSTTLRQLIFKSNSISDPATGLVVITLKRNGQEFRMTSEQVLDPKAPDIWVANNDHIEIENLIYKPGQVFALSGAGNAQMVLINPSKRETLADVLFTPQGVLNNLLAKRSEVYLLRGQNPSVAYHLDTQNVSRILVAAKTELRPNDIVYVADRPIVSFSRTLSEILPLRILLRDIQNDNIP
ncbi:polysaccharide biosynthesis/export family protein [Amylibacter sp.]|nr:polysaccharide biosynthesis/export family protein [Amylibacter sp.]